IVPKVLRAHQENVTADAWQAAAQIASLIALIALVRADGGLVLAVAAFWGAGLLVALASAGWLFRWHKPWLAPGIGSVERDSLARLGSTGAMFFAIQLAGLLVYQTDNLIIAHFLGPEQVTPYSVAWRLFSYTNLLQALLLGA